MDPSDVCITMCTLLIEDNKIILSFMPPLKRQ